LLIQFSGAYRSILRGGATIVLPLHMMLLIGTGMPAFLLNGMSEFMRKKQSATLGMRIELSGSEDDMVPTRKCQRLNAAGRCACRTIGMYSNVAEIAAKTRLKEAARSRVERRSR
jgi:hypothetical protein